MKAQPLQSRTHAAAALGVFGPDGNLLTPANLPPSHKVRWVVRRKAELIAAVRGGLITLDEACERYGITPEEYFSWQDSMNRSGMFGLRATNVQTHRGNGMPCEICDEDAPARKTFGVVQGDGREPQNAVPS